MGPNLRGDREGWDVYSPSVEQRLFFFSEMEGKDDRSLTIGSLLVAVFFSELGHTTR